MKARGSGGGWAYLDAFVGRARELELLAELVRRGERLVTVVGPGGIGKTRLVEELLARLDGSHLVVADLTGARDVDAVRRLIALALDPAAPGEASSIEAIAGGLRARGDAVLFLDNCEHVLAPAAALVRELLERAPSLRVVAASRERLHLRGEHVLELAPLGLPERVEDVERSEAFVLLLDRLRRARVGYAVDAAERRVLFDLVRSLDGIPLAIELAAPRIVALGSPAVLERMQRRFEVLTGGARDLADHQRALRDSIAWSWDLLGDAERACLAQCSVFRGGFSVTAAEAVVDLGDAANAPPIVDVLEALRDKSLIFTRAVPALGGEHRFGLLESLREFVGEKLAPAAAVAARLRHARHYARALEKLSPALEAGDPAVVARLDVEKENLRVLVARAIAPSRGESAEDRREAADLALAALGAVDLARLPIPWSRLAEDLEQVLSAGSPGDSVGRARALLRRAHVR
jgi:predicted ATPase